MRGLSRRNRDLSGNTAAQRKEEKYLERFHVDEPPELLPPLVPDDEVLGAAVGDAAGALGVVEVVVAPAGVAGAGVADSLFFEL